MGKAYGSFEPSRYVFTGYKVKKGDTLAKIARRHNVPMEYIARSSDIPLKDIDRLRVGQLLMIPDMSGECAVVQKGDTKAALLKRHPGLDPDMFPGGKLFAGQGVCAGAPAAQQTGTEEKKGCDCPPVMDLPEAPYIGEEENTGFPYSSVPAATLVEKAEKDDEPELLNSWAVDFFIRTPKNLLGVKFLTGRFWNVSGHGLFAGLFAEINSRDLLEYNKETFNIGISGRFTPFYKYLSVDNSVPETVLELTSAVQPGDKRFIRPLVVSAAVITDLVSGFYSKKVRISLFAGVKAEFSSKLNPLFYPFFGTEWGFVPSIDK